MIAEQCAIVKISSDSYTILGLYSFKLQASD